MAATTRCVTVETTTDPGVLSAAFAVPPMEPLRAGASGVASRVRVPSARTAGRYACVETASAPRTMGPAPHLHEALDERYGLHGPG